MKKRLTRSRRQRVFAGVCGGIAEHINTDPTYVRIGWILISIFFGGLGVLLYPLLILFIPLEPKDEEETFS
ncbi:MAG: PspC domain-containing protein [Defluviitaleaceae bacterium]|nr:PspC domain-containing protein [Defluviitaleaceae bacterium]